MGKFAAAALLGLELNQVCLDDRALLVPPQRIGPFQGLRRRNHRSIDGFSPFYGPLDATIAERRLGRTMGEIPSLRRYLETRAH
jgi:hypothetical protein